MKKVYISLLFLWAFMFCEAQDLKTIELTKPDKTRGLPVMQALSERAFVRDVDVYVLMQ